MSSLVLLYKYGTSDPEFTVRCFKHSNCILVWGINSISFLLSICICPSVAFYTLLMAVIQDIVISCVKVVNI
jgi:hypothetical protein